ncbi:hypothetical protein QVD17_13931 [Tagetes erecta]|uniref:Uncharacterized protein n=1 Tax=Tagetes erecta TaxID=13708 RepID=A0AAD8P3N3_TARER|nr:hypothetical protein QVD17_13931 [Tagetes erecta]
MQMNECDLETSYSCSCISYMNKLKWTFASLKLDRTFNESISYWSTVSLIAYSLLVKKLTPDRNHANSHQSLIRMHTNCSTKFPDGVTSF